MTPRVLILRPEPGASASADRARALGLQPIVAPLFALSACEWEGPDPASLDGILLTSANAARLAGPLLDRYLSLPCHAVGEATAAAARAAGFADVRAGSADGAAIVAAAGRDGAERLLHLCGRDHIAVGGASVSRRIVYAAEPVAVLPMEARDALGEGAPALLHSPRAASLFAALFDAAGMDRSLTPIIAISPAAAAAAGDRWQSVGIAVQPKDEAVLALAVTLCKTGASG